MSTEKVNLNDKLALFNTHWDPKVVGSYNNNETMVVKFQGEYDFHRHEDTDDPLFVVEGEVTMGYEGCGGVTFGPGEMVVVPAGVVHRPQAEHEAKVLFIESVGESNVVDGDRLGALKESVWAVAGTYCGPNQCTVGHVSAGSVSSIVADCAT